MTGTAKSSSALYAEVTANWPSGGPAILAVDARATLNDIIASYPNLVDGVGLNTYNTRTLAMVASVAAAVGLLITGGYATTGDGGGAMYAKVINTAQFPNYPLPTYPTYSFQSADGAYWQYIPGPAGWNSKVAGVVSDGVSDDSGNLMNALLPFQNSAIIPLGGSLNGRLFLPAGLMILKSPVVYAGGVSLAIHILGQSVSAQNLDASTVLRSKSTTTYPSMFLVYGANSSLFEGISFDCYTNYVGSGIVNNIHYLSDNAFSDALTMPVSKGSGRTFHVTSNSNLEAGTAIGVGAGTSGFEIVYVTSVPGGGTTFVADCVNDHSSLEQVGGGPPASNNKFLRCYMEVAPPFVDNKSCGILAANLFPVGTPEIANLATEDCVFSGAGLRNAATFTIANPTVVHDVGHSLLPGTAVRFETTGALPVPVYVGVTYYVLAGGAYDADHYNISATSGGTAVDTHLGSQSGVHNHLVNSYGGFRTLTAGNIKNWLSVNCIYQSLQYGFAGENMSGSMEMQFPTFSINFIADLLVNGVLDCHVVSAETEGTGHAFLISGGGGNAASVTIEECSYQSGGLPLDFYVIKFPGNIKLLGNSFFNQAVSGPTVGFAPRVQSSTSNYAGAPPVALLPGAITSIGNYWQLGGPNVPVFYDGSNNAFQYYNDPGVAKKWPIVQIGDYGDNGIYPTTAGQLQLHVAALSIEGQATGLQYNALGLMSDACNTVVLTYTDFSAAATSKTIHVFAIPPRTKIVSIVADVTIPFTGSASTVTLQFGDSITTANNLLLAFDAKSGTITKGLATADLGASFQPTPQCPDGYCASWGGGVDITASCVSGSGNTSTISAGSVTLYIRTCRFN